MPYISEIFGISCSSFSTKLQSVFVFVCFCLCSFFDKIFSKGGFYLNRCFILILYFNYLLFIFNCSLRSLIEPGKFLPNHSAIEI